MRNVLTSRQELFAQHFALSGNGTQAAIRAGCRNPNSAHVTASRWLQKAKIQERIAELREAHFLKLENKISDGLYSAVMVGLETSLYNREAKRAIRALDRLGIFKHDIELREYIGELERRCGRPIEEIVLAAEEAEEWTDWEEYEAEQQETAVR